MPAAEHPPDISEAAFAADANNFPSRLTLKRTAYGTHPAPRGRQVEVAVESARRLAANLDQLRGAFPAGFGEFLDEVASWVEDTV